MIRLPETRLGARGGVAIVAIAALLCAAPQRGECRAGFNRQALANGDFTRLRGELPVGWRVLGAPGAGTVRILRDPAASSEAAIVNPKPAAAGLAQRVYLDDGWYVLDGEVRTEQVGESGAGARLKIEIQSRTAIPTPELHGDHRWRKIEVYFKVDHWDRQATVVCELGHEGYASSGKAFFRNIRLARSRTLPPPTAAQFDARSVERQPIVRSTPPGAGSAWGVILTLVLSGALASAGWWLIGSRQEPLCSDN